MRARRTPRSASSVTFQASHAPDRSSASRRKNCVVPPRGTISPMRDTPGRTARKSAAYSIVKQRDSQLVRGL